MRIKKIPVFFLVLYADDIVLLSSSPEGLQKSLDTLADFCSCWKLKVNTSKSKIVVFNSNGKSFLNHFKCDGNIIDTVSNYCYLGITLKCNGNFNLAATTLMEKARKAYFKMKQSIGLNVSCKTLEKLFDSLILPIMLYGCEVWGLDSALKQKNDPYESLHVKFIKEILGVHCKTSNDACRSELGRLPLRTKILMSSFNFLEHLTKSKHSLAHDIFRNTQNTNPWTKNIRSSLQNLGFPFLAQTLSTGHIKPFLNTIRQRIFDQFRQDQRSKIINSQKLSFLTSIFNMGERASYVDQLRQRPDRAVIAKTRLSAHNLEVETGRHKNIPVNERLCKVCKGSSIEDENHFLWSCPIYDIKRAVFTEKVAIFHKQFHNHSNFIKSKVLFSTKVPQVLKLCTEYISELYEMRKNVP